MGETVWSHLNTEIGNPGYPDATRVARAFIRAAPERLVWGGNWPHVTETHKPDDLELLDFLTVWTADEQTRNRILVDNAGALYGSA